MKRAPTFLLIVLSLSMLPIPAFASNSNPLPGQTIQQCITTLCTTTAPQKTTYNPATVNGLRQDLGKFSMTTSLTSIGWNVSNIDYLQFNPPTVGPTALSNLVIYYNSTETAWQMTSGLNTVAVYFKPGTYSANVFIQANFASAMQLCLPFNTSSIIVQQSTQVSLTNKTSVLLPSVKAGNEIFSWSDIPASYLPMWNSQKVSLCLSLPAGLTFIDPLALDGSASTSCQNVTSCAITLTTTVSPDVVIVQCNCFYDISTFSISGDGLTWITRASVDCTAFTAAQPRCMEWAANATSTVSGAITVTATNPGSYIGLIAFGISGAQTATSSFDKGASTFPVADGLGCSAARGAACVYNISTHTSKDFLIYLEYNDHTPGMTGGGQCNAPLQTCTQIKDVSFAGVEQQAAYVIATGGVSGTNLEDGTTHGGCADPTCTAFDHIESIGDAVVPASAITVTQGIKIALGETGPSYPVMGISGCGVSNSTLTTANTHTYTLTASCTVTLTGPSTTFTRYDFNISPKPTASGSLTFSTCPSGTCTLYQNTTYYQVKNNFTEEAQTPVKWDGFYENINQNALVPPGYNDLVGTYVGAVLTSSTNPDLCYANGASTMETFQGLSYGHCLQGLVWSDYGTGCWPSQIGNTWSLQTACPNPTTGNNTYLGYYKQSSGTSGSSFPDAPWVAIPIVFLFFTFGGILIYLPRKSRLRE